MVGKPEGGRSWTFSTPEGMEGLEGKGRVRASMLRSAERRGERKGRFFGVTKTVIFKAEPPRRARRWVRSKRGIM